MPLLTSEVWVPLCSGFFAVGVGLGLFGLGKLLLTSQNRWWHLLLVLGTAGVASGLATLLTDLDSVPLGAGLALLGLAVLRWSIQKTKKTKVWEILCSQIHKPALGWCSLFLFGIGLAGLSSLAIESHEQGIVERDMVVFDIISSQPDMHADEDVRVKTDTGKPIVVQVVTTPRDVGTSSRLEKTVLTSMSFSHQMIRRERASDDCNCHGWVFTGGKYWVSGSAVDDILNDNGYVAVETPQAGDIAIYRNGEAIGHTALVRTVEKGMPLLVEGKWGWMGVFIHPVEQSCYGNNIVYYRTNRGNHILSGLENTVAHKTGREP